MNLNCVNREAKVQCGSDTNVLFGPFLFYLQGHLDFNQEYKVRSGQTCFPTSSSLKRISSIFSLLFCSQRLPEDPTTSAHVWTASTLTPTPAPATSSTPASTARLRSTSAPPASGSTSTRVSATGPPRPIGRTATPVGCQVILARPNFSILK